MSATIEVKQKVTQITKHATMKLESLVLGQLSIKLHRIFMGKKSFKKTDTNTDTHPQL